MGAGLLALVDDRDGHLPQPLRQLRLLLQQLAEPDRAREPAGTAAHDQYTDLDPLVRRVGGSADRLAGAERRRVVRGADRGHGYALRARTSSVSLGAIWVRSPITPRSAKSKMGAFGSLLTATIVPELCIPTLCWMAPLMPSAM